MTTLFLVISILAFAAGLVLYGYARKKGGGPDAEADAHPARSAPRRPATAAPALQPAEVPPESDYLKRRLRHTVDLLFSDAPADQSPTRRPPARATISHEVLERVVRQAGSSAEFGTVVQLQRLLSDSNFDAGQISKLISTDPVLSGKVLKVANSSAFGVSGRIDSIGHALMLIGTSNVVNHLCFDSLAKTFSDRTVLRGHSIASLWQHATAASICALFVGYLFPEINKGKLYTMALLHDIGKLIMGGLPPLSTRDQSEEALPVTTTLQEENLYGINHALAGAMLLEGWQIPDSITKPIELHHHPSQVTLKDLGVTVEKLHGTVVLYIADQISRVFTSPDGEVPEVLPLHHSYRKLVDRQQLEQTLLSSPLTSEVKKALTLTHHVAPAAGLQLQETAAAR